MGWLLGDDTGISSRTIMAVMMGETVTSIGGPGVPQDPADFGRCWRMLRLFPEFRERLSEVAQKYPAWTGLVREWDTLTAMFEKAKGAGETRMSDLYQKMQDLVDEGRLADGWEKVGDHSWVKRQRPS